MNNDAHFALKFEFLPLENDYVGLLFKATIVMITPPRNTIWVLF
jgi:hypothetical protein